MNNPQILVLDFGSQYTQLIARRLREYGIYTEIVPYFETLDSIKAKNPKGIILSGGPASVYEEGAYKPDSRIFDLNIPILGICYGMQYIAHFFGGSVVKAEAQEFGRAVLTILNGDSKTYDMESHSTHTNNIESNNIKQITSDTLILREFVSSDLEDIESMLLDSEVMSAWGRALSKQEAKEWLDKQMQSYRKYGFGLFAVVEKSSNEIVGQCGITWQGVQDSNLYDTIKASLNNTDYLNHAAQHAMQTLLDSKAPLLPELGYIFKKSHWHKGLASKAAKMCMEYAFKELGLPLLISLIKTDNIAPQNLAKRLEMRIIGKSNKTFDNKDIAHFVYMLKASDYIGLDLNANDSKKVLLEFANYTKNNPMSSDTKDELLRIWRDSVHATHHFLKAKDIDEIANDMENLLDSVCLESSLTQNLDSTKRTMKSPAEVSLGNFAGCVDIATRSYLDDNDAVAISNSCKSGKETTQSNKNLDSTHIIVASDYDKKLGFIALRGNKIEALFITPSAFKKGVGKALISKALESGLGDYDYILVDCNEANADAIAFYHTLGFAIFGRSPRDSYNRDLALVHFKASSALLMRYFNLCYDMPLFETERLIIRAMRKSDTAGLNAMLLDHEVMSSWEYNFNDSSVQEWLNTQLERYKKFGFGLWAVIEKESGAMIGQAGLSLQTYNDKKVLGMTYIIAKSHWKKGYGAEVALGCKHYAFSVLKAKELYLLIKEDSEASKAVANKLQAYLLGETTWTYRGREMQRLVYRIKNTNTTHFSLETNRTILRPYKDFDYPMLRAILQDKETMQSFNGALSEEEVQTWIEREQSSIDRFGVGWWVITDKNNGSVIGLAGLHYTKYLEMQYVLHKDHLHKGYAIEVALACKEYAFKHLRVKEMYSLCREEDIAAQNVAKRVGMEKMGIVTDENSNTKYIEFCATSRINPLSYTKYSYTDSMESLESLQKNLSRLNLKINSLNTLDSKEVLDLSALWQEYFAKTHTHVSQEAIISSGKNMQDILSKCHQCLVIESIEENAKENEALGFLVIYDKADKNSFVEIFLCTKKAKLEKEGIALLQALLHTNESETITLPCLLEQDEAGLLYEYLGFIKSSNESHFKHIENEISNVDKNLVYNYHNTELPCFIYGVTKDKLKLSLRSFLLQDSLYCDRESLLISTQATLRDNTHNHIESNNKKALFANVKQDSIVWMSHADKVESLPSGFVELAKSGNTHYCAIADFTRRVYALQFHPEVVHSECGGEILKNFAVGICGADTSWNMRNFAESEIVKLREKVLGETCENRADSKPTQENLQEKGLESNAEGLQECNDTLRRSILDEKLPQRDSANEAYNDIRRSEAETSCGDLSLKDKPFSKVLCAVSGGVDSSVVATLLYRAIGENLIPVFVDTGLLRKGEREAVEEMFRENLKVPLIVADAKELFLGRLKGVTDPEQKRKIIGETFIEVFEAEAKKHNTKGEIKFLAQGTLYPDVIESVSVKGPSKTIKSHHNVGGLPEWMKFELIEPLRELFKDEVRALGRELGMPESMLMRHPFPGPGLAIRIMGEVNAADLELLKEADSIFIEELHKWGLYDSVWQAFCVLLNVRSVGVMGDNRTYDNTICVRAVEAQDGMTASFSHLPHAFLESVSNRIINEVAGINRVVYDITSKPPGTIEWE
ncbi:glutamine-hydrolyzing GMP synthase [Helicobacter bilis]|nr:glutamine-hydrolyzing GMP synthase [Helicobacter bilis]